MTDLQILKLAVEHLKVLEGKSQRNVGEMLGYTNESSFSQVLNGKVPLASDMFDRLGKLNENVKKFINTAKDIEVVTPPGSLTVISSNRKGKTELIPFYNADFMAGKSEVFYEDGSDHPDYYMDVPEFYGCIAFRAFGDSMEPIIKSSSILFGSKMDEDWKHSLEYGQIYGITMNNGRRYLKYVRRAKEHKTMFLLKSANKEYDDFEIYKEKIKNLWLIQGWIDKRA
jgi:phage repressor protein C with HTH and peptisase S24 domain